MGPAKPQDDGWKLAEPFVRTKNAHPGQKCAFRDQADNAACHDGSPHDGMAADDRETVGSFRRCQVFECCPPESASFGIDSKRQLIARLGIEVRSAYPERAFAPDLVTPVIANLLLRHNGKIQGVFIKPTCQLVRGFAGHSKSDRQFGFGHPDDQRREQGIDVFFRNTERHGLGGARLDERLERVLVAVQDPPRMDQHDLAALGQFYAVD